MNYYSQYGQDKIIDEILKQKTSGFFIDIGAHNGVAFSNTFFFEKERNWNGICFEPHPKVFLDLKKNRKCTCINKGVGSKDDNLEFWSISGYPEMLSGFVSKYDVKHIERINNEINQYNGSKKIIKVEIISFDNFLKQNLIKKIDYLSIDTEGCEKEIMMSIDFNFTDITTISVENNYNDCEIINHLLRHGYRHFKYHIDDIFIKG